MFQLCINYYFNTLIQFIQIHFVSIVTNGLFSICYDMNVPEEHPLIIRSLFTSSTLTTAFAGTCAIRLYEFGLPFYDIRQN